MSRGTIASINLDALKHNFSVIKQKLPNHPILAMVKADAYGHGGVEIARALDQANAFGVTTLQEAIRLRDAGIQQEMVWVIGFMNETDLQASVKYRLTPVVHSIQQVQMLEQNPHLTPVKIWMKLDTGMHRLGFLPNEFKDVLARLQACKSVQKPIGLMTHLATADWLHSQMTVQQLESFSKLTQAYEGPKSVANSALILGDSNFIHEGEWLRPGIMLYGVSPFAGTQGADYGLRPVMTLKAKIMTIKNLRCGEKVGYGATWQCPEDMLLAVVSIGYGDGYPRSVKNGTPVLVNGVRCAVVGRVSMDMVMIDLRPNPQAQVGDTVILWGDDLPVEEIAVNADGFSYEMLTRIAPRVERHYVVDR